MNPSITSKEIAAAGLAFEALLEVPGMVTQLAQQVADLRAEVQALRGLIPPPLVTVKEAASRFGVTKQTIRRRILAGDLRAVKIGNSVRVNMSETIANLPLVGRQR